MTQEKATKIIKEISYYTEPGDEMKLAARYPRITQPPGGGTRRKRKKYKKKQKKTRKTRETKKTKKTIYKHRTK